MESKTKNWNFKSKVCVICDGVFKPVNGSQKTCGEACRRSLRLIRGKKYHKKYPEKVAKANREYFKRNKKKISKRRVKENQKNREKFNVRCRTGYWIRKLRLRKGVCDKCGKEAKLEVHHLSYNPNKFILVCNNCHMAEHGKVSRK